MVEPLFCCQLCNQTVQGQPLPARRRHSAGESHHDDIESEEPLLINPAIEDPASFLEFDEEYVRAIDGNPRGKATIEILGLNREEIVEKRRDVLGLIKDSDRLP